MGPLDYRLTQLTRAQLLSRAADPGARIRWRRYSTIWRTVMKKLTATLEIDDRRIPVLRESDNVVWFEFAALCDGPRSARTIFTWRGSTSRC
ncbi:MAG: cell division protein ZapE [Planctomycetes bacterium]|nr:cell division protein ZapE [Planctomycetota bacterium]